MGLIWWILPAIAAVIGLMLLFAGFGKLARLKAGSGAVRLTFGAGFLALAGVVAFAGLNLQTYKRLTKERPVAKIRFEAIEGQNKLYRAEVLLRGDRENFVPMDGSDLVFAGDEFTIGADVIKFKPFANMLGYDSIYRLSFLSSIDTSQFNNQHVTKGDIHRINFYPSDGELISAGEPGYINMKEFASRQGRMLGLEDARYGSASFQPMGDKFSYDVTITQDALIARPTEATKMLIQKQQYPGYSMTEEPGQ